MFFWWCKKQTNHAGMSPPLLYIFHFFFCGVDLHVSVSLAFFFFSFCLSSLYEVHARFIVFLLHGRVMELWLAYSLEKGQI